MQHVLWVMAGGGDGRHAVSTWVAVLRTGTHAAVEYGAHVTVLDLTADYLCAGALLTARMGLTETVHLCCGHAPNLPFPDDSFDLVMQNSGM